ncbi:MAG: D-alanyl-D-alanine carboxypeptidase/D-alanyl-D-alanine-endopeptidase [Sorangiineae bacterium]|nr:D-alanyl-D-alanine carboxypeptidase/D-alanyl-D-alanine-endopeptidase [Polyangiaceae bacterium]MEB2323081.1 D-alanyl-D-alanine carboxypeptidase/D-alanyl-D-alanine-endopeptidase [Sorangiineae bacterium]
MRSIPRRALSVLGLVALAGALAERPARADRPAPTSPPAPAARRVSVADAVAELAHWVAVNRGEVGAMVLELGTDRVLAEADAHRALNPASNAKLLTAAVALDELGPDHRFTTGFYGDLEGGTARSLALRGDGDPSFGTEELWRLCRQLVALGVTRVDGDLLVDQSRFDDAFVPPAFEQQPNEWAAFRAPVSAVALDGNAVTVNVRARKAGERASVWVEPPGLVELTGTVATAPPGKGQRVRLSIAPAGARLRVTVAGSVAERLPRLRFRRRVDDPRLNPGWVAAHMLRSLGVTLGGGVRLGAADLRAPLVTERSRALAELVRRLGKESDNFYAEMLLKVLGAERGAVGSSAAGAEVVRAWLARVGALETGTRVVNGSGLFDANRASAWTLVQVLRAAWRSPAIGPEFVSQLAIGGVDGTLRSRFRGRRARRDVRAKTGTLSRSVSLSGYALSPGGAAPIAYSFVVSGIADHAAVRARLDRLVELIASSH